MKKYPFETKSPEELSNDINKALKSSNNHKSSSEEDIEIEASFGYFQEDESE